MVTEATEAGFQEVANQDVSWQFQIGPDINGSLNGVVNSASGYFYVEAPGANLPYVQLSLNNGSSWYTMPNNASVYASGGSDIMYTVQVPNDETIKFLITLD